MIRNKKLKKSIEKNHNIPINYEVLENAKKRANWKNSDVVQVKDTRKLKLIYMSCAMLFVTIIIATTLGIVYLTNNDSTNDPPIYYAYSEDKIYGYDSIEKYTKDKNLELLYFNDYNNIEEAARVYTDKGKDVVICQDLLLLDNYETIKLYIELADNYIFDFLSEFDKLTQNTKIGGIDIKYNTKYDEDLYLYRTYLKFNYKGYNYSISCDLLEENDWIQLIEKLLK